MPVDQKPTRHGISSWPRHIVEAFRSFGKPSQATIDRRSTPRLRYSVLATFDNTGDTPSHASIIIYTRDVNPTTVGFLSETMLPVGQIGILRFPSPAGEQIQVQCAVQRCRPFRIAVYEGALQLQGDNLEPVIAQLGI